mmetsp:Transcript_20358/g.49202  ORF Transcript_20358/g.49202 Transcript_20358/m.49202 type:complete len:222 (+) Transcript_20358:373-1038(+)
MVVHVLLERLDAPLPADHLIRAEASLLRRAVPLFLRRRARPRFREDRGAVVVRAQDDRARDRGAGPDAEVQQFGAREPLDRPEPGRHRSQAARPSPQGELVHLRLQAAAAGDRTQAGRAARRDRAAPEAWRQHGQVRHADERSRRLVGLRQEAGAGGAGAGVACAGAGGPQDQEQHQHLRERPQDVRVRIRQEAALRLCDRGRRGVQEHHPGSRRAPQGGP